jgi:hypothetical protein
MIKEGATYALAEVIDSIENLIMRTNVHAKDMSGRKCNKCLDESI